MKIFAVGMNYIQHNKELDGALYKPESPVIFTKADSALLKDKKPGLKEFSKNWFKGKEGKARKKEAKEDGDGTWMLDMYDAYLAENGE